MQNSWRRLIKNTLIELWDQNVALNREQKTKDSNKTKQLFAKMPCKLCLTILGESVSGAVYIFNSRSLSVDFEVKPQICDLLNKLVPSSLQNKYSKQISSYNVCLGDLSNVF